MVTNMDIGSTKNLCGIYMQDKDLKTLTLNTASWKCFLGLKNNSTVFLKEKNSTGV